MSSETTNNPTSSVFAPLYIHRAYGMNKNWAEALENTRRPDGRRLPGSARRVLDILLAAEALGMGEASLNGIVRISNGSIPRSSAQGGLKALSECGIITQGSHGWRIVTHGVPRAKGGGRKSAPDNREFHSLVNPMKASAEAGPEEGPVEKPQGKNPSRAAQWARELRAKGHKWAWSTAKKLKRDFVPGAVDAAMELAKEKPNVKDCVGLAAWILAQDWNSVMRYMKKVKVKLFAGPVSLGTLTPTGALVDAVSLWRGLQAARPDQNSPGHLDHDAEETRARRGLCALISEALAPDVASHSRATVESRIADKGISRGSSIWNMVFASYWEKFLLESSGLEIGA